MNEFENIFIESDAEKRRQKFTIKFAEAINRSEETSSTKKDCIVCSADPIIQISE